MSLPARLRAWVTCHPRASDVLLAVSVVVPSVLIPADAPSGIAPLNTTTLVIIVLSCSALVLRRDRPLLVWLTTLVLAGAAVVAAQSPTGAFIPLLVALYSYTVSTDRRRAVAAGLVTATVIIALLGVIDGWATPTTYAVLAWSMLAVAIGTAVKSSRAVVAAAEERALRAEATREEEAQRRVTEERLRIARELHDVVAHHISVVNVQSGVALHLLDADPAAARQAIGHVREASQEVLSEMASLLGLLRTGDDQAETQTQPAPGLSGLDDLVDSMRRTGLRVTVREEGERLPLAPVADLAAYRVVQESLTNAHKHGAGDADLLLVHGDPLTLIEVRNPQSSRQVSERESGLGLVGMRERVAAAGGSLDAGPDGRGTFVVRAELPSKVVLS